MQAAIFIATATGLALIFSLIFVGRQVVALLKAQRRQLDIERALAQYRRAEQWGRRYDDESGIRRSDPPPPEERAA